MSQLLDLHIEIKNLLTQYEVILEKYESLKKMSAILSEELPQRISKLPGDYRNPDVLGQADTGDNLVELVIMTISNLKRPLSITELHDIVIYTGLIPIHIVNAKNYLERRLNVACDKGKLSRRTMPANIHSKPLYDLISKNIDN